MANDLKPMLAKVLASGGKKKFYFAYGTGKRKDGKGDGEMAVSGKKPKKTDIEGELSVCKDLVEGMCWLGKGPDDSETVYFLGKKLSSMILTKMALCAKAATSRQYDFQIPSKAEEDRAGQLNAGEGEEQPTTSDATSTPTTGTTDGVPENLEVTYQARVKALTEDLKKALTSGTAAGKEVKLRYSEVQIFAGKKNFEQALAILTVVEDKIKQALAEAAAPKKEAPTDKPGGDLAAEYKTKLAGWSLAIKKAMLAKGPNAAAIAKLLTKATELAKPGGDMAQAIATLTECHNLAASSATTTEKPAKYEPLLPIWVKAKEDADVGIGKLQDALRATKDDDLVSIAEFGLYGATTGQAVKLMAALRDADSAATPEAFGKVVTAVDQFRDYIDGARIVDLIEENKFGVAVPLRKTLGKALDEVERLAVSWA